MIHDLVETHGRKIRELHFNNGPHPLDGRANRRSHHRILADRRIDHAAGKFLREILRRLERAPERTDILPVDEHPRIVPQRARLGFANGLEIRDAHGAGTVETAAAGEFAATVAARAAVGSAGKPSFNRVVASAHHVS